jgi:hypothetical protein
MVKDALRFLFVMSSPILYFIGIYAYKKSEFTTNGRRRASLKRIENLHLYLIICALSFISLECDYNRGSVACNSYCRVNPGYQCINNTCNPFCGDGLLVYPEV